MRTLLLLFLITSEIGYGNTLDEHEQTRKKVNVEEVLNFPVDDHEYANNEKNEKNENSINDISDDYELFQQIILSHFVALKERGEKIQINQITKLLSGEFNCPNDQYVKEIDAERVSALNDREALHSRLEDLDEQLMKTEGQLAAREQETYKLRREITHYRELIRVYENHKLLHELSVQEHCTELVSDLSTCRGELASFFEERNRHNQLNSDYESATKSLQECHQKIKILESSAAAQQDQVCQSSRPPENSNIDQCSKQILAEVMERVSSKFSILSFSFWKFTTPLLNQLESFFNTRLHPLYLQHLHPTIRVVYRQYLFFLNTPLMVEVLAYVDFILRKMHVLLYRLHIDLPRVYLSVTRFLSIVWYRSLWNLDLMMSRLSFSLSRAPVCGILSSEEWYLALHFALFSVVGGVLFLLRKRLLTLFWWIIRGIIAPFRWFLFVLFAPFRSLKNLFVGKEVSNIPPPPEQEEEINNGNENENENDEQKEQDHQHLT